MNIGILLSMISLIPLFSLGIFLFSSNTYAVLNQNASSASLAPTNGTFAESESRIPSSVLDGEEETTIISNNETAQESETLQNQAPSIENIIKTKFENKSSSYNSTNSNVSSKVIK
jgi:hypothetical protein